MKSEYLDEFGIDSMKNLREAVRSDATIFVTNNQKMIDDRDELQKAFDIQICTPTEVRMRTQRKE